MIIIVTHHNETIIQSRLLLVFIITFVSTVSQVGLHKLTTRPVSCLVVKQRQSLPQCHTTTPSDASNPALKTLGPSLCTNMSRWWNKHSFAKKPFRRYLCKNPNNFVIFCIFLIIFSNLNLPLITNPKSAPQIKEEKRKDLSFSTIIESQNLTDCQPRTYSLLTTRSFCVNLVRNCTSPLTWFPQSRFTKHVKDNIPQRSIIDNNHKRDLFV